MEHRISTQAERDHEIASIIWRQLGIGFFLMVGASHYVHGNEEGLSFLEFRFKMFSKANRIRIILDSDDTYRLRFMMLRGAQFKVHKEIDGVYADGLHEIFRSTTGLETQTPRFVR